jgi:hypothetical protein
VRWAALALAGLALTGCETTQEKSARLERVALHRSGANPLGSAGLKIARASTTIRVLSAGVVHSSEGAAVAVTLRNDGAVAQRQVPLLISVHDAHGKVLYSNSAPGLSPSLVSAALVPAHGTASWVDDQIQIEGIPSGVSAKVGEGSPVRGRVPEIAIGAHRLLQEPGGIASVTGSVANRSAVTQRELVVTAIATRGGKVVGAGRAVLTGLAGGASGPFQIFLVGSAGTGLSLDAPPSTLG